MERVAGFASCRGVLERVTGPLTTQALAAQIFGLFIGLTTFTPILGGLVGDRLLGRRRTVVLGALAMAGGHFALAFDGSFLLALVLLIGGAGCLNGNIMLQVGLLYPPGDRRSADGFQVFFIAQNIGAFIAPLLTGALAATLGWHVGFAVAGAGMLVGLAVYLSGRSHLLSEAPHHAIARRGALLPEERRAVLALGARRRRLERGGVDRASPLAAGDGRARPHVVDASPRSALEMAVGAALRA